MRKETDSLAFQVPKIAKALGKDENKESENKVQKKMSVKKEKGKLTKGRVTLYTLQKEIDIFQEATKPRKFEEVRCNLFVTYQSSWKVEDSQKGWS